jgi:hypothetical protein
MALQIPMPGLPGDALLKGMATGGNLFTQMINPVLQREKQKQMQEQFDKDLALRKQQEARLAANLGINRKILEQQLINWRHKNDPMYELNQFAALQNMMTGGGQGMPQQEQQGMPAQPMGEGMGMFSPQGMEQAQQHSQMGGQGGGVNLDALRQNPMLRGFFKHKFGYDPLAPVAQTPEEKQHAALDLFKQKEAIKAQGKSGDIPTNTVLTQNQQALQGIDTVVPMLDELINNPDKVYGRYDFSPSKKAAYNAKTSGMIDTLVAAQSLPKVQASIDLVEQQIRRGTNESDSSYIERLKDLRKDLINRRSKAQSVIKNRKVNTSTSDEFANMSDEELRRIAGGG